ncbi:MAG: acyltransferase [Lachnospiraceae bacterium]|nr:acyltransferase [Lachnospiraceae bacterium]MDE7201232.1 acyltransferase [Lachnospiraceae bacterium]
MRQFAKRQATAVKGIAILMMFWHHLYLNMETVREAGLNVSFFPFPEYNIVNLAKVCKICVSLYVIVSGYGLYLDYSGTDKEEFDWIKSRVRKLLTD